MCFVNRQKTKLTESSYHVKWRRNLANYLQIKCVARRNREEKRQERGNLRMKRWHVSCVFAFGYYFSDTAINKGHFDCWMMCQISCLCFTDIFFPPQHSINFQMCASVMYMSLYLNDRNFDKFWVNCSSSSSSSDRFQIYIFWEEILSTFANNPNVYE